MTFAILVEDISIAFQVPLAVSGLSSSIVFIMNMPCFLIAVYVYNNHTTRIAQFWAVFLLLIGSWTRYVAKYDNDQFYWIILGQAICGSAFPLQTQGVGIIAN